MINFIVWMIAGGMIGWIARVIMPTNAKQGALSNIIIGIVGAFLSGLLLTPLFGVSTINQNNFSLASLLISMLGAIILQAIVNLFRRNTTDTQAANTGYERTVEREQQRQEQTRREQQEQHERQRVNAERERQRQQQTTRQTTEREISYYKILQVDPSAEPEVITGAYRRLAAKYHPDLYKAPDATRKMQLLNEAYSILNDPAKRKEYDEM